jgi:hypothetical protein
MAKSKMKVVYDDDLRNEDKYKYSMSKEAQAIYDLISAVCP